VTEDQTTMAAALRIYTTDYCGYCRRAVALLRRRGIEFEEIDVSDDPATRKWLRERTGERTVPQVFIHDGAVGGCDELVELDESGELDALLAVKASG